MYATTFPVDTVIIQLTFLVLSSNVVFAQAPHKKIMASIKIETKLCDLFAKSEDNDAYLAFNSAMEDVETQLLKNLEKVKSHK